MRTAIPPRAARSAFMAVIAAALLAPAQAAAQAPRYLANPVRIIVPLPPAGTTDIVARMVAQKLTEGLGQTAIVDNRMVQQSDLQERSQSQGLVPVGGTPAQLGEYIKSEIAGWTKVVKEAGIKAE